MLEQPLDLSLIIVSWNVRKLLDECLCSAGIASKGLNAETYVIDNASHDGSPQMVAQKYPGVHLIANPPPAPPTRVSPDPTCPPGHTCHPVIRSICSKSPLLALCHQHRQPAIVARKHIPSIWEFGARLSERKLPVMAIITAAMQKLLHLICGVLNNQLPFDPEYGKQFAFNP